MFRYLINITTFLFIIQIPFACRVASVTQIYSSPIDANKELKITGTDLSSNKGCAELKAAIVRDKKYIITSYYLSEKCSCAYKHESKESKTYYRLTNQEQFDLSLNDQDKFVLKQIALLPEMRLFKMSFPLDSAKGFTKM
jgi:hypothetical protein